MCVRDKGRRIFGRDSNKGVAVQMDTDVTNVMANITPFASVHALK